LFVSKIDENITRYRGFVVSFLGALTLGASLEADKHGGKNILNWSKWPENIKI